MSINKEGGCCCGAIRYRLEGLPIASMICHCRSCRRASGAPVMAWASMTTDCFTVLDGEPTIYSSSPGVTRWLCSTCGSQLACASETHAGTIDIATATLDDAEAFPPTHHSWVSHDLVWVRFGDDLPTYQRSRADG